MTFIDGLEGKFDGEKGSGEGVTQYTRKERTRCSTRLIPLPQEGIPKSNSKVFT